MAFGTDASNRMGSLQAQGEFYTYKIPFALKVDDSASQRMYHNTVAGDGQKITKSFWLKLTYTGSDATGTVMSSWNGTSNFYNTYFSNNRLYNYICDNRSGFVDYNFSLDDTSSGDYYQREFRDLSQWYHFVVNTDTTQTVPSERGKIYINGVDQKAVSTGSGNDLPLNYTMEVNEASGQNFLFHNPDSASYYGSFYIAELVYVDGAQLGPEYFGELRNGIWIPKKIDTDAINFGNNGFYLDFADASDLGKDVSGEGHHFTSGTRSAVVSNFSASDQVTDTPTNNWCTNNGAMRANITHSEGNLKIVGVGNNYDNVAGTFDLDAEDADGWYWEYYSIGNDTATAVGIARSNNIYFNQSDPTYQVGHTSDTGDITYQGNGNLKKNTSGEDSYGNSWTAGDIIGIAVKAGSIFFYKNGVIQNSGTAAQTGITGSVVPAFSINGTQSGIVNYGQDPSFAGTITAGTAVGGGGTWKYGPPAGYKALKARNLPEPTFSPRNESIENSYFYTVLYEGNGGGQRVGQFLPLTEVKTVNNAILFNDDDTQYLSYTPSASNRRTFTFSAWIKVNPAATNYPPLFNADTSTPDSVIRLGTSGEVQFVVENGGGGNALLITNRKLKDPTVWYHLVCNMDTTSSTADERLRIYVDGEEITDFSSRTNPDINDEYKFNSNVIHKLGAQRYASYWDGYMADVHFVDGLQLDASYFGQTDPSTEKWIPKTYSGSHGTNGFHLEFENNNALLDSAGSNHFDANTGNPIIIGDSPTDNFPVLTTLPSNFSGTLAKGNLQTTVAGFSSTVYGGGRSTIPLPKSGKWYCEVRGMATGDLWTAGVSTSTDVPSIGNVAGPGAIALYNRSVYIGYENDYGSSENQLAGLGITKFASGDVLGIHVDMDAGGKVWFSHNGTQFDAPLGHQAGSGAQGNVAAGTNEIGTVFNPNNEDIFFHIGGGSSTVCHINFGQNPSFNGSFTGGDVGTQVREGGTFKYMPTTGYKPLRVDLLPGQTKGIARRKTPVITWIKNRDATDSHMLFDSLRGPTKVAHPDLNASETTEPNTLQKFLPGGFQIGNDVQVNTVNESYVAWNWCMHDNVVQDTPTGSGFSNGVRLVDPRVGLSIITYTATAGTGTIDHGLGQTPDMIIATDRGHDVNWFVWHKDLVNASAGTHILNLDGTTSEFNPGVNHINDTAPTASAFAFGGYMGAHADTNSNGQNKMLYAFKSVPGFSKFGYYTGNLNTDGTYVDCGFKPAFVLAKNIADTTHWAIWDNQRNKSNVITTALYPSSNDFDQTGAALYIDFLSNGFKLRMAHNSLNGSSDRHIFWAMAESPFKYTNAR